MCRGLDTQTNIRSCVVMAIGNKTMQNAVTTSNQNRKSGFLLGIVFAGLLGIAAVSVSGTGDFTTTTTEQSSIGNVITSDTSFVFNNAGVSVATNAMSGAAAATSAQEITSGTLRLRTNGVTMGHFVYSMQLVEASALPSGTWTVQIFQDGTQVGNTITITQATAQGGTNEGATIIADMGTSLPVSNVFEVKLVKTA